MGSILGVVVGALLLFPWVFVAVNAVGALLQQRRAGDTCGASDLGPSQSLRNAGSSPPLS